MRKFIDFWDIAGGDDKKVDFRPFLCHFWDIAGGEVKKPIKKMRNFYKS
jgi:hypothetical protein